ncbi:hypothetical protein [Nocardioides daphniae]|uniref:Alpha/beta hydrolase n=1 Tax=Nocardioides daphniae TaxID=402297 RepID=A0A4P7UE55_9ACTN|nr:hypothetical protein [Nocardioides daphniae]QCC77628.1 hypothetical protein E2C04_11425 [Nocardioides daphniae]
MVTRVGDLTEAKIYANHRSVRASVMREVLEQIPASDEIVVVAHSLGSVIAADLLTRLPERTRVRALVTLGSPLASDMWKRLRSLATDFPYDRVDAWINVFDPRDAVTYGRGVAARFPMAVDVSVDIRSHSVRAYASHPAVGALLGHQLYGQRDAHADLPPARQLGEGWHLQLLGFAYAEQLSRTCQAKKFSWRKRFDTARRISATRVIEEVEQADDSARADLGATPSVTDFVDRASDLVRDVWSDDDLLPLAVSRYASSPLPPFDIAVDPKHRLEALTALLNRVRRRQGSISDLEFATAVATSVEHAQDALTPDRRRWWGYLVGGGAVLLALTGVGLWAVLPTALAGAAAITATLAAFGPGGMVGGMLTLVLATGAGTALVSAGAVAATGERDAAVEFRLAVAGALTQMRVEELRGLLVGIVAVIRAQEALGMATTRPHAMEVLLDAQARLAQELHLHTVVAPKRPGTKEMAERADLLHRAIEVLTEADPADDTRPVTISPA